MPKGAGYYEPISEDSSLLTDEEKEVTRRNALANEIRKVFFGAELHEIQTLLTQYKADMEREARVMGKKLKGDDKETYQKFIDRQAESCEQTNKMLDTLQNNKALTKEELANFNNSTILIEPPRGDIPKGEAEKQLADLLSDVRFAAADLQENEQKKQLDVAFEDRVMMPQWHEKLQEFFQKKDTDIYNTEARDKYISKYGNRASNLAINLNDRVGEAVTAIYKGELNLPGLKIGNYVQDETAPQNTAKQLVNAVGAFAFLDYGARASFLDSETERDYVANKNSEKDNIYGATLDDILLNGNVKTLETLKKGQPYMLQDPEGALKEIDDLEKNFDSNKLDFNELKTLRKNTSALSKETWENVSRGETNEAEAKLAAAESNDEKKLFEDYSKEWLQERFDNEVGYYWGNAMWPGKFTQYYRDLGGGGPEANITAMEKTIAAHLCSAHDAYREDRLYDNKKKEFYWEKTKDVLTLDHRPSQPINDTSIKETINYFKEMCAGKAKATAALEKVDLDKIKLYYDSAVLNREAKLQEERIRDNNSNKEEKAIKMEAYVDAMKRKFSPYETGPIMISRAEGEDNVKKWSNYVSTMLKTNEEFRKAVHDKILIPGREPELKDMENDFIYKLYDTEYKPDGTTERPDFASHEAELAKRDKEGLEKMPDLSKKYSKDIKSSEEYAKRLDKLQTKYKEESETIKGKKTLVHPTQYNENNKQSEVLAEATEKAGENYNKTRAQQEQVSKNLSETFKKINEKAVSKDSKKQDDPKNTRITTLDALLSAVGDSPNREEARKNIMNNTKKLKRGWLNVLTLQYRNKAASRFRNMLEDIAARPDGVEMKPAEMMELYNAAEKVKFSLDQGKSLTKTLKGIDKNRYDLATKVAKEMKEKLRTEGLLSPEKTKERPSIKKQPKQPDQKM